MRRTIYGGGLLAAWVAAAAGSSACAPSDRGEVHGLGDTTVEHHERRPDLLPVSGEDATVFDPLRPGARVPSDGSTSWKPKPCPALFGEALQTFEIEVSPGVWDEIEYEYENCSQLYQAGFDLEAYRPVIRFTHGGKSVTDAMIRLRGNTKFWDHQDKMQFQISFNELNPDGRFRGLRKLVLDSAYYNPSYLHDRLATSIARDAGVIAPCVGHARLYVNGQFYGLYALIEKIDREFLERNFREPGANLYKMSRLQPGELKTNEDENPDTSRFHEFWRADRMSELEAMADVSQMVRAWALEAVFPNADGYWAGGWNFYLYDEPGVGFSYLLWDLDRAFDERYDVDPISWHKTNANFNGRPHVELVLADPKWRWEFIRALRHVRDAMDVQELQERIDRWAAGLRDSALEDPHAPWTFAQHEKGVQRLRDHVKKRLDYLDRWLACWERHDGEQDFYGPCPD